MNESAPQVDLASKIFLPPDMPQLYRHPSGIAMTEEGGIFLSVSGIKRWRSCKQEFLQNLKGLTKRIAEDHFTLGGCYGQGVQAWILNQTKAAAKNAIDADAAARMPKGELLPDEKRAYNDLIKKARRWVTRYTEVYPDPQRDFTPICGEGPFFVQLPGSPHWLLGLLDLPFLRDNLLGFVEVKTSAVQDKIQYVAQYEMDDQMLGYSWATGQLAKRAGLGDFGGIWLDVLAKPRKRKGVEPDPDYWRHLLTPQPELATLWAQQAAITAEEVKAYIELTEMPNLWTRNYGNCLGMFKKFPCTYYQGCFRGDYSGLVQSGRESSLINPFAIMEKMQKKEETPPAEAPSTESAAPAAAPEGESQ